MAVTTLKGQSFRVILCKLDWPAAMYHLWFDGNQRVLKEQVKSEEGLLQAVKRDVGSRLALEGRLKTIFNNFFSAVFAAFPALSLMGLTCCD